MKEYTTLREMLNSACKQAGVSQASVAESIGKSAKNFSNMLGKGTLTFSDWCKIADYLHCDFVMSLNFDSDFKVIHTGESVNKDDN